MKAPTPVDPGRRARLTVYQYTGLIFGIGALMLTALALFTAREVQQFNTLSEQSRHTAARRDLDQAVQTLLADARGILREVTLWDETSRQIENPGTYQFWWRNTLMNPARVPHYVQAMEVYDADGNSLNQVKETPMPESVAGPGAYVSWDGYGDSLFQVVPILDARGNWPPIGFLGVRISLLLAIADLYEFDHLVGDSLEFDLLSDEQLAPDQLTERTTYRLRPHSELQGLVAAVNQGTFRLVALNMLILILGVWGLHALIARPLHRLEREVSRLDSDKEISLAQFPPFRVRELDQLGKTIDRYHSALSEMAEDLDRKNAELWSLAHLDPLTGVRNRRAFEEDWEKILIGSHDQTLAVSFIMFDCDQLKSINDAFGHETGDQVIRTVADQLSAQLPAGAHLYRLGGDEFATVLCGADADQAKALAMRCETALASQSVHGLELDEPLTISTGVAQHPGGDRAALEKLPREADVAMYRSKRSNRVAKA